MITCDCVCFSIKRKTIEKIIDDNKITSIDELHKYCDAGKACKSCIPYIELHLKEISQPKKSLLQKIIDIIKIE